MKLKDKRIEIQESQYVKDIVNVIDWFSLV